MAGENTAATISGMLKEVYAPEYIDAVPAPTIIQDEIGFVARDAMPGNLYHQPVLLQMENGATYAAGSNIGTAYSLNAAVAAQSQDAQIKGAEIMMRARLAYGVGALAQGNNKSAFIAASEYIVRNLIKASKQRGEIAGRYGGPVSDTNPLQSGLASIASKTGSSTTRVWTIALQSWAPGIWWGKKGALIDVYNTSGVKQNTNADISITAIDLKNRTLSVSGNSTDLTTIDGILPNAVIYWKGAYGNEMLGLQNILSTATTTLFNIDPTAYELWKPVPSNAGGVAGSFQAILQAVDAAVARGLDEQDLLVLVPAVTWTDMAVDYAALRRIDQSYRPAEGENGVGKLVFHGQSGKLTLKADNLTKYGDIFCIAGPGDQDTWMRVGSQELTLNRPGTDMPMVLDLPDNAGWEIRSFQNWAMFTTAPPKSVYVYNVTPTHSA